MVGVAGRAVASAVAIAAAVVVVAARRIAIVTRVAEPMRAPRSAKVVATWATTRTITRE